MINLAYGLITIMLLSGCAGADTSIGDASIPKPPNPNNQIIVKFREANMSVAQRDSLLHEISQAAGTQIIYLRPLSEGVHLLSIEGVSSAAQLQQMIEKIEKSPGIEYAESNRLLHHMKSN